MLDNGEMSNSEELRAVQAPLKQQYRDEPAAALITLRASGELGEGVTCSVATGRAIVQAGLHPATGGDGLSLCSGDMLLEALVACAGVTLRAVATSLELDSGATEEQLDTLIRLTERYCVVLQTIRTSPEVSVGRTAA